MTAAINILLVGLGGGLGAISRYGLSVLALRALGPELHGRYPAATLVVNVVGCFLAGGVAYFLVDRPVLTQPQRLLLLTGFLGGLTTFSAFAIETLALFRSGQQALAAVNVVANVLLSMGAVWLGWWGARAIWS